MKSLPPGPISPIGSFSGNSTQPERWSSASCRRRTSRNGAAKAANEHLLRRFTAHPPETPAVDSMSFEARSPAPPSGWPRRQEGRWLIERRPLPHPRSYPEEFKATTLHAAPSDDVDRDDTPSAIPSPERSPARWKALRHAWALRWCSSRLGGGHIGGRSTSVPSRLSERNGLVRSWITY